LGAEIQFDGVNIRFFLQNLQDVPVIRLLRLTTHLIYILQFAPSITGFRYSQKEYMYMSKKGKETTAMLAIISPSMQE